MNDRNHETKTLTALIIDDEDDICFLLSNILRNNQLKVDFVQSLGAGKNCLKTNEPDILFLDNHLPDGRGLDFIEYVKREHADTKIVMVTAHDAPEDKRKALAEGANIFISKPFSSLQIKEALKELYPGQ